MMSEEQSRNESQFPISQTFDPRAVHRKEGKEGARQHTQTISEGGVADIDDQSELAIHVRWQMSRSLTTQHLLTVVSITNTLMNQSAGAHALSSNARKGKGPKGSLGSDDDSGDPDREDSSTVRDNIIRAVWSRIAALHCVMLPERMDKYFRPPHLPVLAARFMDPCQAIQEAAQALLQSELHRVGRDGRRNLVSMWAGKLQTPSAFTKTAQESTRPHDDPDFGELTLTSHNHPFAQATPTQQQQTTALIILGMIGAEFNTETKSMSPHVKRPRSSVKSLPSHLTDFFELLDPAIARHTAKTLQAVLLEKPVRPSSIYSPLRCSAAELMGRGFHLWENYVDVAAVVMGLLDLAINSHGTTSTSSSSSSSSSSYSSSSSATTHEEEDKVSKRARAGRFVGEIAKRALNLMVLLRPVTIVLTLAKEVSIYQGTQHGNTFPHSARPPIQVGMTPPPNTPGLMSPAQVLLPAARDEILSMMRTILDKCSTQISMELLDVVDIVLFCLNQEELKRANFMELFPSLSRLPNVSYSHKNRRLAVGARSGQVAIYDLKQAKVQMITAHSHPVTVLRFSDDGKMLATYSYGGSLLDVWQIGTSLFGGVINQPAKRIQSWPAVCSNSPSSYSSYARLEWVSHRSIILHMPGGIEYKYSL